MFNSGPSLDGSYQRLSIPKIIMYGFGLFDLLIYLELIAQQFPPLKIGYKPGSSKASNETNLSH